MLVEKEGYPDDGKERLMMEKIPQTACGHCVVQWLNDKHHIPWSTLTKQHLRVETVITSEPVWLRHTRQHSPRHTRYLSAVGTSGMNPSTHPLHSLARPLRLNHAIPWPSHDPSICTPRLDQGDHISSPWGGVVCKLGR